jgi:CBS domain-containing protein
MHTPQSDDNTANRTSLSRLSSDQDAPDVLGSWTLASVIPRDVELVFAKENDSVEVVKTLMHMCDFSQIPVLSGDRRRLLGSITWKSLARFSNEGKLLASAVMIKGGTTANVNDPLLKHIERILSDDYIFVRDEDGLVSHIATTTDLANSFYEIAGPFMKLREIEKRIRHLLEQRLAPQEVRDGLHGVPETRSINGVHDLTFGHYVEIMERPACWEKIALPFDRVTIVKNLRQVNQVRNRVMHFRPEPLTKQQSLHLDWCLNWLQECYSPTRQK